MQQGEAIIRPSSKGDDHLTVTWKVTDEVHQHIDIREEGKENKYSLGRSLWIGNEEFEDLDEIIARHINPMAAYTSELLEFKYYKAHIMGMKDKAEEILKEQKRENPGGIPYLVSAAKVIPMCICGYTLCMFIHENNLYLCTIYKIFLQVDLHSFLTELPWKVHVVVSSSYSLSPRVHFCDSRWF